MWDDFGGDWDWANELANFGSDVGDVGEWFLDSVTGEVVNAADMESILGEGLGDFDQDFGDAPLDFDPALDMGDFGDLPLADSPISRSTSDMLRSMEGAPEGTMAPGREKFDWTKMADPTASIASAGGPNWAKLLAQGLQAGLGALGSGLGGRAGAGGGDDGREARAGLPSLPGMMGAPDVRISAPDAADWARVSAPGAADVPRVGGLESFTPQLGGLDALGVPRLGGPGGLDRPGMQEGINAILARLQAADPGARLGLQGPIDPGPIPRPFTPLVIPTTPGGAPMAQGAGPRMSGLQRLLLERLG